MFNNWINFKEISFIISSLWNNPKFLPEMISFLPLKKIDKIKKTWSKTQKPPVNWWDIPAVQKRWNYLISGDYSVGYREYICRKYFFDKKGLLGLSLGCGGGLRELGWAETCKFSHIDAYDLSDTRIKHAIKTATTHTHGSIISFRNGDVSKIELNENSYDVILSESSLHHFSPLPSILHNVHRSLKSDGYFIVNEFVGPTRFQWTDRQLEVVNALLTIIPKRYKKIWNSTMLKRNVLKPSRLRMVLRDPSEAIESSKIVPLLYSIFDVVEMKGYGGSLLQLLFKDIAYHFLDPDDEASHLLDICFKIEDFLIRTGDISNDFIIAVCRKRV